MKNKLFAGAVFAFALFVAANASAYTFDSKIDTLQEKKDVQTVLNMSGANLTVDGVFGAKTISAIKTFQGSKNLVADGKIGPMTRAALTAASAGPVTGTLPAGCTSAVGFSSTTGVACSTVTTLPAGCTAGAAFSSTTGASCTGSTTVSGPLQGGAGSIGAVTTSTDVNSYMVEGQADAKVLGFKVTATDSDAKISNIKVTLDHSAATTGSNYLDRYVSDVSIWMNGVKVGSASAADFSKDSSGVYTKSIALNNAIVKMGTSSKATFYVTITGISNIDSVDMSATPTWKVSASDFRYTDATGVIMTYLSGSTTTLTNNLSVKDINGTGDVKLVITKDSTSPAAANVKVSDTASTSGIVLLAFKAKDTGAVMDLDTMKIDLVATTSPLAMIGELTLKANGSAIATWTPTAATLTQTATFDLDTTYTLPADSTTLFTVEAKINDIDNFTSGAVTASYNNATPIEVTSTRSNIAEEGAAQGETQTFFAKGIVASAFTYGTPVVTTNTSGTTTNASYAITFKVTASGNSYYIRKDGLTATGANISFAPLSATTATESNTNYWLVSDGDTATFTTTGAISSLASGFTKIGLLGLKYNTSAATSGESTYTFSPASSFETSSTNFVD